MSAVTITVGYPVHAVRTFRRWQNSHQVRFTDWAAACGQTGTRTGWPLGGRDDTTFGRAGSARRAELCRACFPAGHSTSHPEPVEVDS